jgi:hypothetical protein
MGGVSADSAPGVNDGNMAECLALLVDNSVPGDFHLSATK